MGDGPANVQSVQARLTARHLAYTTVQTMLNVLERKGKVKRRLKDRAYFYQPIVSRQKATSQAVVEMLGRFFGGSADNRPREAREWARKIVAAYPKEKTAYYLLAGPIGRWRLRRLRLRETLRAWDRMVRRVFLNLAVRRYARSMGPRWTKECGCWTARSSMNLLYRRKAFLAENRAGSTEGLKEAEEWVKKSLAAKGKERRRHRIDKRDGYERYARHFDGRALVCLHDLTWRSRAVRPILRALTLPARIRKCGKSEGM